MNKTLINIVGNPTKNDILVFDGKNYVVMSKKSFLNEIDLKIVETKKELDNLTEKVKKLNEILKEHHEVLQILTKED